MLSKRQIIYQKEFMGKMDFNLYKKIIDEAVQNGTKLLHSAQEENRRYILKF